MHDSDHDGGLITRSTLSVLLLETRCVARTLALLIRNRLAQPRENVGRIIRFGDGSRSRIYRETAIRGRQQEGLVLIVVRFRLRWIDVNRVWHALFRFESLFNTLLFAAQPGFQTKLWLTDSDTGYYRGIYEWLGHDAAVEYAETLRVVLRPWVENGSFTYRVIEGVSRHDYLAERSIEASVGGQ